MIQDQHDHNEHGAPERGGHRHPHGHGHSHGVVDPSIASSREGLWALKWSFVVLGVTSVIQGFVFLISGSVGLLADTIHNVADASTAIPLGVAFWLARRGATRRFTYGYGRVEDLAGIAIIVTILGSAIAATYEATRRLLHPQSVEMLWAVMLAAIVGFIGNEGVAVFRIRVGRKIGSAALIADGYHARVDGWISLAVLVGAVGIWAGYPLADPIVGLLIAAAILVLVWQSARAVLLRVLDGVETSTIDDVAGAARHVEAVQDVTDVRARWVGHRIHVDISVTVPSGLSVAEGHDVAHRVRHQLLHHVEHLGRVNVHVDPSGLGGEAHHRIGEHAHDGLPRHAHD
jgi:cation diffusion facilitator family transporter